MEDRQERLLYADRENEKRNPSHSALENVQAMCLLKKYKHAEETIDRLDVSSKWKWYYFNIQY